MINLLGLLRQATTGFGSAGVGSVLLAVAMGQMTWTQAAPALIGSAVLILWPEKPGLRDPAVKLATDVVAAAPPIVADFETLLEAYRTGLQHGSQGVAPPKAIPAPPTA